MRVHAHKRGRTGKEIVAALREPVSLKHRNEQEKLDTGPIAYVQGGAGEEGGGGRRDRIQLNPKTMNTEREGWGFGRMRDGRGKGGRNKGGKGGRDKGEAGKERGRGTEGGLD